MKRWLIRIVALLVIFEVTYVALVNVVLNHSAIQSYINQIHPDRYVYKWDQAWSWYPFRVQVINLSANGQTWSQQWQVSAPEVTASISILPLLWKTAVFYDLDTANIDVRFRPRPSPDRKDADVRQFYPTIEGRDPTLVADSPPEQSPGWKMIFEIASLTGDNNVWVKQVQSTLSGEGRATITHQSHAGPLTVSDGYADATLKSLKVDGQQVSDSGSLKGTIDFASFRPQDNRGIKSLAFMTLDAEIDVPIESLDFLNFYLGEITGLTLDGTGELKGRIAYDKGDLITGTDLAVTADNVKVVEAPYSVNGSAELTIKVDAAQPDSLDAAFRFSSLSALHQDEELFTGKNLAVTVERSAGVLPGENSEAGPRRVAVDIPLMTVSNLATYQQYVPDKWHTKILAGTGSLQGTAEMSATDLSIDLTLKSEDADLRFKDDNFVTNLELVIKTKGTADESAAKLDVSGTYLTLDDSRVTNLESGSDDIWRTNLTLTKADAEIKLPLEGNSGPERTGFWQIARDRDLKTLLSSADADLEASLTTSDLNWIQALFQNPYSLSVHNSAEINADVKLSSGNLVTGSNLKMKPRDFKIEVLDYIVEGDGGFDLVVEQGGETPDLRLNAKLADGSLRLVDEKTAVVDQVTFNVTAAAKGVSVTDGGTVTAVELNIPSANVEDMSSYNQYFPSGTPVRLLSGKADLSAKVTMQPESAGGFVKLQTSRVDADLQGQRISGTVGLDVTIKGGAAEKKMFDITGSTLKIDGVRIAGKNASASGSAWNGRVDFGKSHVTWKKPVHLDASTSIRMTDTRPLVEIFESHKKTHKWLDRILTLKDVRGNATVKIEKNEIVIPYSLVKSDTIEVGAKGIFRDKDYQGMFYARYGKLAGILEIDNGKKHFGLIGATKKFKEYVPGGRLPGMHASGGSSSTKKSPFSIFKRKK